MKNQSGFTLIEVLIAMIVLAMGLLGLAALQATGLKNNLSAYNRSQATQLAYDIADRMRSNITVTSNYKTASAATATCSTGDNPCTACGTTANSCTPAQLAVKDLYDWNLAITSSLPNATGTITQSGVVFTISITWTDSSAASNTTFQMNFQP